MSRFVAGYLHVFIQNLSQFETGFGLTLKSKIVLHSGAVEAAYRYGSVV